MGHVFRGTMAVLVATVGLLGARGASAGTWGIEFLEYWPWVSEATLIGDTASATGFASGATFVSPGAPGSTYGIFMDGAQAMALSDDSLASVESGWSGGVGAAYLVWHPAYPGEPTPSPIPAGSLGLAKISGWVAAAASTADIGESARAQVNHPITGVDAPIPNSNQSGGTVGGFTFHDEIYDCSDNALLMTHDQVRTDSRIWAQLNNDVQDGWATDGRIVSERFAIHFTEEGIERYVHGELAGMLPLDASACETRAEGSGPGGGNHAAVVSRAHMQAVMGLGF